MRLFGFNLKPFIAVIFNMVMNRLADVVVDMLLVLFGLSALPDSTHQTIRLVAGTLVIVLFIWTLDYNWIIVLLREFPYVQTWRFVQESPVHPRTGRMEE